MAVNRREAQGKGRDPDGAIRETHNPQLCRFDVCTCRFALDRGIYLLLFCRMVPMRLGDEAIGKAKKYHGSLNRNGLFLYRRTPSVVQPMEKST